MRPEGALGLGWCQAARSIFQRAEPVAVLPFAPNCTVLLTLRTYDTRIVTRNMASWTILLWQAFILDT